MFVKNHKTLHKKRTMTILRRICAIACTTLCVCPLLMACQGLQDNGSTQEHHAIQEQNTEWNLSPNAEYIYHTILFNFAVLHNDVEMGLEAIASMENLTKNEDIIPETEWYVDASTFLFFNEEQDLAYSILQKGLQHYPSDSTLALLYAEASEAVHKQGSAVLALQHFYASHQDNAEIRLALIRAYIANQQFAEAESLIQSIPTKEQDALLHYYYAKAAVGLQNTTLAIRQLKKAIQSNQKFSEAYAELAYIYELQGNYAKAEQTYKGLMDIEGNNIDLWLRIIDMNMKLKKPQNAYTMAMQGAKSLKAHSPVNATKLLLRAAHIFIDAQDFSQAKDIFYALEKEDYPPQEAYFFLAAILYEQDNDSKDALHYLEKINVTSEYHNRALQLRAQIEYELGQHKKALDLIERGIQLYPQEKIFYEMCAQIYINAKQYEHALTIIDNAVAIWPKDADILSMRGSILEILGRFDEAFEAMRKAMELDPSKATALNYVAYTLAGRNENLHKALEYAQKAVALEPNSGQIMDTLAWVHFKLGHLDEALIGIEKALKLGADEAEIWEHYGDIALAYGDKALARKAYTKALSRQPHNADTLKTKLHELEE